MSGKNRPTVVARGPVLRAGEGAVVPVLSTSGNTVTLALGDAPVPDRRYPSNVAGVEKDAGNLYLLFGQRKRDGKAMRSLIELAMPFEAVPSLVDTFEELRQIATRNGMYRSGLQNLPLETIDQEPDQTVSLRASMALSAVSGDDAVMDFYYASPKSVQVAGALKKLGVEPVVRITMPAGIFLSIMDRVKELAPTLPRLKVVGGADGSD